MTLKQRVLLIGLTTTICVGIDQLSKVIAKSTLNFADVHSYLGAARF